MDKRVNDESLEFRKTYLKSKYDYLSAILKKKEYVEIIKSFNQTYSSSTLLEMAKQRINSIEKGEIRKEDLEKVELQITLLFTAIQDKELINKLLEEIELEEQKEYYKDIGFSR